MISSEDWKSRGKFVKIGDKNIFVIDEGDFKSTVVILHGYPTSSYDYCRVLPELKKHFRVVIHDHLGFGFSDQPDSLTYSLIGQADIALQLWNKLGLKEVTILAHDYGTSVAKEILARKNHNLIPLKINKILLCNSSMRLENLHIRNMGKLLKDRKLGKFIARLTSNSYQRFKKKIKQNKIDPVLNKSLDIKNIWNQFETSDGKRDIHLLSNFINERYTFWHRWTEALKESEIPVKIVWEKNDPIAVKEIAIVMATENLSEKITWVENDRYLSIIESPKSWMQLVFNLESSKII